MVSKPVSGRVEGRSGAGPSRPAISAAVKSAAPRSPSEKGACRGSSANSASNSAGSRPSLRHGPNFSFPMPPGRRTESRRQGPHALSSGKNRHGVLRKPQETGASRRVRPFCTGPHGPAAPDAPGVAGRMLLHGGAEGGMVAGIGQQSRAQSLLPVQKPVKSLHGDGPPALLQQGKQAVQQFLPYSCRPLLSFSYCTTKFPATQEKADFSGFCAVFQRPWTQKSGMLIKNNRRSSHEQ